MTLAPAGLGLDSRKPTWTLHFPSAWPMGFVPGFGFGNKRSRLPSLPPVGVEVWQWRNVQLIAIAVPGGLRINPLPYIPQVLPNSYLCNTALLCRLNYTGV